MTAPGGAHAPDWYPFGRDVGWTHEATSGDDIDIWSIAGEGMFYVAPTLRPGTPQYEPDGVAPNPRVVAYAAAVDALAPPEEHRAGGPGLPPRFGFAVAVLDVEDAVASLLEALA